MPFRIDSFKGSAAVQAMHPSARSGYLYLLSQQWQSDDGTISGDALDLAEESGLGDELWRLHGPRILRKFEPVDGQPGRLRNVVCHREWLEAKQIFDAGQSQRDELSRKRREAGLRGNAKRWGSQKGIFATDEDSQQDRNRIANDRYTGTGTVTGTEGESAPAAQPPDAPQRDWPMLNCARWLLETCGIPVTFPNQQAVSAGIGALSRQRGSPTHSAAAQLCALARDALREGIPVDRFWFEDAKWRRGETAKPAHPKIKPFDAIGQLASQIEQLHGFDCGYDPVAMVEKAKAGGVFDGRSAKPEEVTERLRQVNATREKIERSKTNARTTPETRAGAAPA